MKRILCLLMLLLPMAILTACGDTTAGTTLQDGYYTAQASEFSHGWKEYITILVKSGSIVSVEYNAENASGFIKSWDNAYMQTMLHAQGTYPNEYTRYYAGQILSRNYLPQYWNRQKKVTPALSLSVQINIPAIIC